ncbi:MAG: cysteate synthase [Elainellaceae cyanobacterium]
MSEIHNQSVGQPAYMLRCLKCEATYAADPFRLHCDADHEPSLLRAVYANQTLEVKPHLPGIFQFIDWLPVETCLNLSGKPITYASHVLANYLGLERLFISFNGYWQERNANLLTCSFKELEAPSVLGRVPSNHSQTLVIASAGNTGRAFANVCSQLEMPLCLVIPESSLSAIWSSQPFHPNVKLIVVGGKGDYSDAIALGKIISQMDDFFPEGGAANVARRDGMGITVLDAVVSIGQIPDHYFQAVGSGTGGISAWEANLRFLADGRFGDHKMKLHLAQNAPFTPMVDAWNAGLRELPPTHELVAREQIQQVSAHVLTNRHPAYGLIGGVYDALRDTQGKMYGITNAQSDRARCLFEELEGIDICPASGVATAALLQAVEMGTVKRDDCILLNITSGGTQQIQREHPIHYLRPWRSFLPDEIRPDLVADRMGEFCHVAAPL